MHARGLDDKVRLIGEQLEGTAQDDKLYLISTMELLHANVGNTHCHQHYEGKITPCSKLSFWSHINEDEFSIQITEDLSPERGGRRQHITQQLHEPADEKTLSKLKDAMKTEKKYLDFKLNAFATIGLKKRFITQLTKNNEVILP